MGTDRERLLKMALNGETIHSGHFMASNVHEKSLDDDEEIDVVSESGVEPPDPDVTPDTKDDKPVTFYKFGPQTTRSIAIDVSLTKLNKCIQIAYEKGKLTTPKWKNFKGMKLQWKDRIRLNNVIWRAWHMQFVQNNKPKYCFFSVPEEDWHYRSEASILEGMYWKRRLETVCAQYTRWRHFYFKQGQRRRASISGGEVPLLNRRSSESDTRMNLFDDEILFPTSFTPLTFDNDDDFTSWFTDTLFSSLNQPYMFPDPKQFAQSANADLMQPGLTGLQPSLEEIMASLESSSNFLTSENDPTLAAVEQMEQPNSADDSMDLLRSSSVAGSSSSSSNHYTRKDYADASLLVNYSKRATSSGPPPTPAPSFRSQGVGGYQNEPIYPDTAGYPVGSLCEPYVSQVATIDTIRSQPVQYTVAKTWSDDVPPMLTISPTQLQQQPQQQSPRAPQRNVRRHFSLDIGSGERYPTKISADNNLKQQESHRSCTNSSSSAASRTRSAPVTEGLLKAEGMLKNATTTKQQRRTTKKKASTGKKVQPSFDDFDEQQKLLSPTKRDVELVRSPPGKNNNNNNVVVTHSSSSTTTTTSRFTDAEISVNCDNNNLIEQSMMTYSNLNPNNSALFSSPSSSSLQNSNVLRPIPISFGCTNSSAFSPLSPTGSFVNSTNNVVLSPMQRSPASSTDFLRNSRNTPTPTTVVHVTPTCAAPFLSAVSSTSQTTQPVLILQSLGGVQFPFIGLPYATATAPSSFPSTLPKQEPLEKLPVSIYNPLNFVTAAAATSIAPSMVANVKQEPQAQQGQTKNVKTKSTKRAADSTVDPMERKRMQHLYAEQSRRSALKNGFELLEEMLPDFQAANTKATNALVLMKSAERIRELKDSTVNNTRTINRLKSEIQELNDKISAYQNRLPVPAVSSKSSYLQQKHSSYVKLRSQTDSKFWLLHKVMEPLFESFKNEVQGVTRNELFASAQEWATKHCNHAVLRPVVSQLLVSLATDSPILSDPSSFSAYAFAEASKL